MKTVEDAIRESQVHRVAEMHYKHHSGNFKYLYDLDSCLGYAIVKSASVYLEPYRKDIKHLRPFKTYTYSPRQFYSIHTHVYVICKTCVWKVPEDLRVQYTDEKPDTIQEGKTVGDFISELELTPIWIVKVDDTLEERDFCYQNRTLTFTLYQYPTVG